MSLSKYQHLDSVLSAVDREDVTSLSKRLKLSLRLCMALQREMFTHGIPFLIGLSTMFGVGVYKSMPVLSWVAVSLWILIPLGMGYKLMMRINPDDLEEIPADEQSR